MATNKQIRISITSALNAAGIEATKEQVATMSRSVQKSMQDAAKANRTHWADIKAVWDMGTAAIRKAWGAIRAVLSSAFHFETQTQQFKTLIGNIDEAKAHMADLKALGDTPPFSLDEFAKASRSLMVMTDGALGYKKSLEMIGDAAAATGHPIEEMGQAVGRLYAFIRDGQPLSRAVMQLRNMGVITPEVAQKLQDLQAAGKSNAEIWAEVEAQLGRYKGAMSETEKTGEGLMGAIKSRWDNIVRAFGLAFADTAKEGMGAVLDKAKQLEEDGTLEVWATKVGEACRSVAEAARVAFGWIGKLVDGYNWIRDQSEQGGAYIGGVIGTKMAGGSWDEAWKNGEKAMRDTERKQKDRDLDYEKIRANAVKKVAERKAKEERDAAKRAADEEKRIQESLAAGQKKTDERNAKAAAEKRAEEEKKAAEKAARERERLDAQEAARRERERQAELAARIRDHQKLLAKEHQAKMDALNEEIRKAHDEAQILEKNAQRARGGKTFGEWERGERDIARDQRRADIRQRNVVGNAQRELSRLEANARRGRAFTNAHDRARMARLREFIADQDPANNPALKRAAELEKQRKDAEAKMQKDIDAIRKAIEGKVEL